MKTVARERRDASAHQSQTLSSLEGPTVGLVLSPLIFFCWKRVTIDYVAEGSLLYF